MLAWSKLKARIPLPRPPKLPGWFKIPSLPGLDPRVPIGLRLKAWWRGDQIVVHGRPESAPAAAPTEPAPISAARSKVVGYRDPARPWETPKVVLAQGLWGSEWHLPGGAEYAAELIKPFGLNPAMTVVDLHAGLGGSARSMASQYGLWVTGYEYDDELAEAGKQLSEIHGLAKKAPVTKYNPEDFELRPGSCDCILVREILHRVREKNHFMKQIAIALKPGGQLLLTDFVLSDAKAAGHPAVKAWLEREKTTEVPWTLRDYQAALPAVKMDTRVAEDVTPAYRGMIISGWASFTSAMAKSGDKPDAETGLGLTAEAERWMRLVAAMDAGDIRVYRIHALRQSGKLAADL
jgi:SAM-dependent methyltransferase